MPDLFTLEIEFGNDSIKDLCDISDALQELAEKIVLYDNQDRDQSGSITDINGNTVGSWKLS